MKTWGKVMLFLMLPMALLCHYAKKSTEYMEGKAKPAIAMLVAVVMLLSVMPMTAFAMQVFIEVTIDDGQQYITLEVEPTDRIEDIKAQITDKNGTAIENQTLIFNGQVLEDGNTIQDYSIQKDSTIKLIAARALNISEGNIVITETGYTIGDADEMFYNGAYVVYGATNQNTITVSGNVHHLLFASLSMMFSKSSDLLNIESENVSIDFLGQNVLQATSDGGGSAIKMSNSTNLHLDGSGQITMVGGSNYWGGSHAVLGVNLYIDGGDVTLVGGTKIVNSYGHAFQGNALIVTGGTLSCGVGYLNNCNLAMPTVSAPVQAFCGTLTKAVAHNLIYSNNESVITESCTNNCGHAATATLTSSAEFYSYTGSAINPLVVNCSSGWVGDFEVVYENNIGVGEATGAITIGGVTVTKTFEIKKAPLTVKANNKTITYGDAPANNGVTYTGFVNNETAAVLGGTLAYNYTYSQYGNVGTYDIIPSGLTSDNYEITFQKGTLTVEKKEIGISWGATMFLPYTGSSLVPKATATNLENGDECILTTAVVETADGAGIIPGTWMAKVVSLSNGNYKLPASGVRVTAEFEIINGSQNDAPVASAVNETIDGKADGKITGVNNTMEYRKDGQSTYTAISGTEVTGLADGTYYVRYAAKTHYHPSPEKQVTIGTGRKLKITVPQNTDGFTVTTTANEVDYLGNAVIRLTIHDGYSKTDAFKFYVNGVERSVALIGGLIGGTICELNGIVDDINIEVEGIADITAPTAQIEVVENRWTSFWNNLTFSLFFKETQDVTITADATGSGIKSVEYYLANAEMTLAEAQNITDWQGCNGTFKIDPNNRYVVYAKVTDNAGNTLYINSDGITLDSVAPTLEGVENGQTYYGNLTVIKPNEQFYDIKVVTLDGVPMSFEEGTYGLVPADNEEHTIIAEDHAGNKTTYTVTVMKNYTVTYKVDGEIVDTQTVGHGKDATAPTIPAKDGYTQTAPTWDKDGKNIIAHTEINAVYTQDPVKQPDDTKSPQTGDNSIIWLWAALMFVSGGCLFGITFNERKRKAAIINK